ncbi:hypothetical protein IscW_ISCW003948 [Ixodes scapularis]|uniref:Uncharacterized protein n=1 Tax=Ixodes scapularis TaxID=6945 RepID=B7PDX1_IXOSC|nr:hypothetical protein IscW_ISCW003948 [Ixodes scapularis]|eukprot:XP_002399525.1 hypothetical protein IscW_ISCW003948 [Ixodes scapularis]
MVPLAYCMCFLECATGSPDKTAGKRLGRNEGSRGNRTKKTTRTFVFLRYSKTHNVCRHLCFLRVRRTLGLTFQLEWPQLPSLHLFFFFVCFLFFFEGFLRRCPSPPFPRFFRATNFRRRREKKKTTMRITLFMVTTGTQIMMTTIATKMICTFSRLRALLVRFFFLPLFCVLFFAMRVPVWVCVHACGNLRWMDLTVL